MTKLELAKRWHVTVRAINTLLSKKEIEFDLVESDINVKNKIDFPQSEIERFEKERNIPQDPLSSKEAKEYLGVTDAALREFKNYMKDVGSINSRVFLYSKAELKKWKFFLRDKNIETYN